MGNMPFQPGCFKAPRDRLEGEALKDLKPCFINMDSTTSTPMFRVVASSAPTSVFRISCPVTITHDVVDLQRILSNYRKENFTKIGKIPSTFKHNQRKGSHEPQKELILECDHQMTFYVILKQFSLIQLHSIKALKFCTLHLLSIPISEAHPRGTSRIHIVSHFLIGKHAETQKLTETQQTTYSMTLSIDCVH